MEQNHLSQLLSELKQNVQDVVKNSSAPWDAYTTVNDKVAVKAVDMVYFTPDCKHFPWTVDQELMVPLFNLMDYGNWDDMLSQVKSSTGMIYKLPEYDLSYMANFLLQCCMRVIYLQGHTETSESKEALTTYLRKNFVDSEQNTEATGARALCSCDVVNGHQILGTVVVNMLSDLIALRQRSFDDLKDTPVTVKDLSNLLWVEASTVTTEAARILTDGDYPGYKDDTDEIIGSASLEPYADPLVCREIVSTVYSMPSHFIVDGFDFRLRDAYFVLSVGILTMLKYLCGEITPGMITELFADECGGCDRCRIDYYRRHIFLTGSELPFEIPMSLKGYASREPEKFYPLFTAATLCRSCPKEVIPYAVAVPREHAPVNEPESTLEGEIEPDSGYKDNDSEFSEDQAVVEDHAQQPEEDYYEDDIADYERDPETDRGPEKESYEEPDSVEDEEPETENSEEDSYGSTGTYSDGYTSSSNFYRNYAADSSDNTVKDAGNEAVDDGNDTVGSERQPERSVGKVIVTRKVLREDHMTTPVIKHTSAVKPAADWLEPMGINDMNDTVDSDIKKAVDSGSMSLDLDSGFAPSELGGDEDEQASRDRIG